MVILSFVMMGCTKALWNSRKQWITKRISGWEVDLLSYSMKTCKVTSIRQVTLMDKVYYLMTASDLDALCECQSLVAVECHQLEE